MEIQKVSIPQSAEHYSELTRRFILESPSGDLMAAIVQPSGFFLICLEHIALRLQQRQ